MPDAGRIEKKLAAGPRAAAAALSARDATLDRVKRVVKVLGFGNAGRDFLGLSSRPSNVSVEIELTVEVR